MRFNEKSKKEAARSRPVSDALLKFDLFSHAFSSTFSPVSDYIRRGNLWYGLFQIAEHESVSILNKGLNVLFCAGGGLLGVGRSQT